MWRFLLVLVISISFDSTIDKNNIECTEPIGPPTCVEYMLQMGYSAPDTFVVTAYLAIDEFENRFHGITFSGVPAKPYHTIAVDPDIVPLGAWVFIEGLGWWRAEDTGNLIKGNRLDICLLTRNEAMQWGKQNRQVWVLAPGERNIEIEQENVMLSSNSASIQG